MDSNPYRPPTTESAHVPTPTGRSTAAIVFGIFNIVWGALALFGFAFTSLLFLIDIPQDPRAPNPVLEILKNNQSYRLFMQVSVLIGIVFAILLIAGGIGLLRSKRWGRSLSLGYAWYAIVAAVVANVGNWFFVWQPSLESVEGAGGPAMAATIGGMVSGLLGGCFGLIYPILLLVFMNRQSVKDSLA